MTKFSRLSIWKSRRFTSYAAGLTVDRLGNAIYTITLPLLVYDMTQSLLNMSIMAIAQFAPKTILCFFIGAIIDGFSRRSIIFYSLIFQSICSAAVTVLYLMDCLPIIGLYIAGSLISIGFEFSRTAEMAIVPRMFGKQRTEATATLASLFTLMLMFGPAIAGLLLTKFSYLILLAINTLSYLAPIIACYWSKIPHDVSSTETNYASIKNSAKQGFHYVFSNSAIRRILIIGAACSLACAGILTLSLFHLKNTYEASDQFVSLLFTCNGIGMFVASVGIHFFHHTDRVVLIRTALGIAFIGLALLFYPNSYTLLCAQFFVGLGAFSLLILQDIFIQDNVPDALLGRVNSATRMLSHIAIPASTALLMSIANLSGIYAAFCVSILLLLAAIVVASLHTSSFKLKDLSYE